MIQTRFGIFETNSSSTHSLILCTDETYQKFMHEELFVDWDEEEFVSIDALRAEAKKIIDPDDRWRHKYPTPQEIDAMEPWELIDVLEDWDRQFGAHNCSPGEHREMLLPSGERVHALSEFYYNN